MEIDQGLANSGPQGFTELNQGPVVADFMVAGLKKRKRPIVLLKATDWIETGTDANQVIGNKTAEDTILSGQARWIYGEFEFNPRFTVADFGGGTVTDTRSRIWSKDCMVPENPPGDLTDHDDDLIQISDTKDSDTVGAM